MRDAELARREQATDPAAAAAANDEMLHVLLKCFHHTVASYMPNALVPTLPRWLDVLAKLLERAPEFDASDASDDAARGSPRAKTVKRALQALVSLVTRHRRHVDKALRGVCSLTARLAGALARARLGATEEAPLSATASRQCALCFDLLARVAETAPGFKLLGEGATFGSLLETAVFPALCAAPVDEVEFVEDEEEYLRANLPTDSDDPTGFNEELYAPRQSAANLLALLAERGGGGGGGGGKNDKEEANAASSKRKKGGGGSRGGARRGAASGPSGAPGDVALRFLERFAPPPPEFADVVASSSSSAPEAAAARSSYHGAIVAYGALARWLEKRRDKGIVGTLARRRILPVLEDASAAEFGGGATNTPYATSSAMLRACACWALGELSRAEGLPEEATHAALLRAMTDPRLAEAPAARSAAASAIAAALQASCWPKDWAPLLTAAAAAGGSGSDAVPPADGAGDPSGDPGGDADADAARLRAARLIAVAAEAAPEKCGDPAVAGPLCAAPPTRRRAARPRRPRCSRRSSRPRWRRWSRCWTPPARRRTSDAGTFRTRLRRLAARPVARRAGAARVRVAPARVASRRVGTRRVGEPPGRGVRGGLPHARGRVGRSRRVRGRGRRRRRRGATGGVLHGRRVSDSRVRVTQLPRRAQREPGVARRAGRRARGASR